MGRSAYVCVAIVFASGLAACEALDTQLGSGGSAVTGSAGDAGTTDVAVELPRCASPLGVAALVEEDIPGLAQAGLSSPVPLVRLMIAQSGCFLVVDRGQAMERLKQERELAEEGALTAGSNIGGNQLIAADYMITPNIIFQDQDAGGAGGGVGAFLPGFLGLIAGGLKLQDAEAETLLTLTNVRTGVQEAIARGTAQKKDLSWFGLGGGFGGLPVGGIGGGYASTDIGKIVAAAFLDAYANLVAHVRALQPHAAGQAPTATTIGMDTSGTRSLIPTANAVYVATATVNLRALPSTDADVAGVIMRGRTVTASGPSRAGWWQVTSETQQKGWVYARYFEPSQ